jgi:Mn-dependent DtxR family transcriptional regulator
MKELGKSSEDYLETILLLSGDSEYVRSIDIAREMGFSKPSVSAAVKKLREDGHITVDNLGYILLTKQGKEQALRVWDRHKTIHAWLRQLGVSEENAEEDACKIEHILSDETFWAIRQSMLSSLITK